MAGVNGATASGGDNKAKVVLVMGATATGKSKLAIDLALRFGGEVVNSDKIQVHDGLDVVTNKVTAAERQGVPHHLIDGVAPDADYTTADFCRDAVRAVESILERSRVPIIAGGSNRYLEALLDGEPPAGFRGRYECCFLWVDSDLAVLDRYIGSRVDCMLEQGLVREVRAFFRHDDADYSRGIRRAIGVPEMDMYFRMEAAGALDGDDDDQLRVRLLAAAVNEIKANTCGLARRQLQKIHRLHGLQGWSDIHRLDVTEVLQLKVGNAGNPKAQRDAWETDVVSPAARIVGMFLAVEGARDKDKDRFLLTTPKEVAVPGVCTATADWFGQQLDMTVMSPSKGFAGLGSAAAAV
ncbi:Adenylate isopentenyltransferase 5, chloroplastic [Zea mays]|uniref:adenylate dimethylallyltransferase (ADP/ATP-dependent) n=1 Tax=Zea mays TaxID=4577 RepID=A0A3L6FF65_MAIZE|nr:Adenylate isopentenyltransferase 5, chloroplastic [Zea mays]